MAACFTYGSLMCADIMQAVCGRPVAGEPVVLPGHVRHPVVGEDYPGLVEAAEGSVTGVLYRGLDAAALARLDVFEGEQYERVEVLVEFAGARVPAWVYRFRPEWRHLLLPGDWDFEAFLRAGKARFEARYMGFDRI